MAEKELRKAIFLTTSALPLPWPLGYRSETLRPPLSVEFPLFSSSIKFIGIFAKTLNFI
jgi:hypothetical protein